MFNLLFFIIVLEALSREIRSGCPEELLYADDLAFVSETLEGLKGRLEVRKTGCIIDVTVLSVS